MKTVNEKWALVTGASAGVGKEFALLLARQGWNLLLASRSASKLQVLRDEILKDCKVQIDYCAVDLAIADGAEVLYSFCQNKNRTIDLLINNAGAGLFGESVELGISVQEMLILNMISLTKLCVLFGKDMKERQAGSILNVGSLVGNQATPFFASYAASKSYVTQYSLALRQELADYGVNVTCVQPGYIRTTFDDSCKITSEKYKQFSYRNGMSAQAVARLSLQALFKNRPLVPIGFMNKCAAVLTKFVPKNLLAKILKISILRMS